MVRLGKILVHALEKTIASELAQGESASREPNRTELLRLSGFLLNSVEAPCPNFSWAVHGLSGGPDELFGLDGTLFLHACRCHEYPRYKKMAGTKGPLGRSLLEGFFPRYPHELIVAVAGGLLTRPDYHKWLKKTEQFSPTQKVMRVWTRQLSAHKGLEENPASQPLFEVAS